MMDKAALHPVTRRQLEAFIHGPSHALCLVAPPGAGKGFIAQAMARTLLGRTTDDALYQLGQEAAIGIEDIRSLQQFLRLKKPGAGAIRRVVILEQAHLMRDEAQNALLKTLEEPPADVVFIITTDGSTGLKPTIYSRAQTIRLLPLSLEQAQKTFKDSGVTKAYHLSGGYPGLLYALLHDQEHQLVAAVDQAKTIVKAPSFERLLLVEALAKQKDDLPMLFYALQRVMGSLLPQTKDVVRLKRLTTSLRAVYEAELDLAKSANAKLLLTDLFLQL